MFIRPISASSPKNNLNNKGKLRYQAPLNSTTQLSRSEVSFKSQSDFTMQEFSSLAQKLLSQLEKRKNLRFEGKSPEEKLKNLESYYQENYPAAGERFKAHINPVLEFLASKGILIKVDPYIKRFEVKIAVQNDASSHLSKTWRDSHRYNLDSTHYTFFTPNSARAEALYAIRHHSNVYMPSLFSEDRAAMESEWDFDKYRPKLPKDILEKIGSISGVRRALDGDIQHIHGITEDLYEETLKRLMPEEGILSNDILEKIQPVADDYTPEYAKPFDWERHRRMMERRFTI